MSWLAVEANSVGLQRYIARAWTSLIDLELRPTWNLSSNILIAIDSIQPYIAGRSEYVLKAIEQVMQDLPDTQPKGVSVMKGTIMIYLMPTVVWYMRQILYSSPATISVNMFMTYTMMGGHTRRLVIKVT